MECGSRVVHILFPSPGKIEACAQGSTCNKSPGKRDFFSSSGTLVNLVSTVSTTAGGGVPPGSALHLPVSIATAGGGVPPGSALHLLVSIGAAGGGGPSFHLPINTGVFPSVSTSGSASSTLEYLPLYAPTDSSAHSKYY